MTQIQAYEDMSKEALIEHHKHTLQQHADDMDMLAKELAGKGMRPYSLNLDPLGIRALTSDAITGAFEYGRLNTYRPPEGHWLAPFWKMGNAASPATPTAPAETLRVCGIIADKIEDGSLFNAGIYRNSELAAFIRQLLNAVTPIAQAQWIEHCNITDIPDAVLTPSGLAIKSEQADHIRDATKMVARRTGPVVKDSLTAESPYSLSDTDRSDLAGAMGLLAGHGHKGSAAAIKRVLDNAPVTAQEPLPPLNDDLIAILGRPNFMCAGIAQLLRDSGHEIKKRAENEQAAALHFLLGHYLSDPQNWNWKAAIALNPDKTTCTCPSADGTQKWPCPVHPPESVNLTKSSASNIDEEKSES